MTELYAFLFSLGLGIFARGLYLASTALAKRTNLLPVTVALDLFTALIVGGAFTLYVIITGTTLAPYMFAALLSGYYITYVLTRKVSDKSNEKREKDKRTKHKKVKHEVKHI